MLTMDVVSGSQTPAKKTLNMKDFGATKEWQSFPLDFTSAGEKSLEFRTYWHGKGDVKLDHIKLEIGAGS